MASRDRAVWVIRLLWFALPLLVGPAFIGALDGSADGFGLSVTIGSWLLWAAGLICVAVLLPATLTGTRILAPAVIAVAVWAAVDQGATTRTVVAVVAAIATAAVAFSPLVGDRMVDGASYGDERRMLLRPPTRLAFTVVPATWVAAMAGALAGPLVLVSGRWFGGAVLTLVGLVVCALAVRALHQLSQRWAVFVPTGLVLHDLQVLAEPVLFRRTAIERLGPAIEGTPAKDLTNRAAGLLIECELTDPAPLGLRMPGDRGTVQHLDVRRFMFVPTLPGALLDEAQRRRIAVD